MAGYIASLVISNGGNGSTDSGSDGVLTLLMAGYYLLAAGLLLLLACRGFGISLASDALLMRRAAPMRPCADKPDR